MKKPRKPRGNKPYKPVPPPKTIQSSTRVAEFEFSEYNFDVERLSELFHVYPVEDYRYDSSIYGTENYGDLGATGRIIIYSKDDVLNASYGEQKARYDKEYTKYKEDIKVWNQYEGAMKEYNQWRAEEADRKQYERLRKKYENE